MPLLNPLLPGDARLCRGSPGERLWLVLRNVLAGQTPWYRVAERFTLTDVEIQIGTGRCPAKFTDDSLGRPSPSPSCRVLTRPTTHEMIRHLRSVRVVRDTRTGTRVIAPPIYHPTLAAILDALQVPPTVSNRPYELRRPKASANIIGTTRMWVRQSW